MFISLTWGRARAGAADLRRLPEMERAAPWRTPPELALQGALGESSELAVLFRWRRMGDPMSFCTVRRSHQTMCRFSFAHGLRTYRLL